MEEQVEFDIAVIGAGSAGPKAARTAAKAGAKVAIFEEALIGGECLYTGCVPSKALINSATLWTKIQRAAAYGLPAFSGAPVDFGAVMRHAHHTIEEVGGGGSAVDSFARQGITTICERAKFIDPHTVETSKTQTRCKAKQFILCTGSLPSVPPIPGLAEAGYVTNRDVFDWTALPPRIVVLGGGAIGCELGQVFRRFGASVTILHNGMRILARDDADAALVLHDQLVAEGVRIVTEARAEKVTVDNGEKVFHLVGGEKIACDAILVAAGRKSNVGGLNLDAVGVEYDKDARLKTNAHLQTNVPHIWAAGDVTSEYKFTHVASYEGAVAASNALSALRGEDPCCPADYHVIPRVTYTDPEVASVGLTPAMARLSHHAEALDIARFPFAHLDKSVILGDTKGFVQIVSLQSDGTILGAQIVGVQAGGLINELCLAMRGRLTVADIALTMHAYPTLPEAVEAAALSSSHAPLSPCQDSYLAHQ